MKPPPLSDIRHLILDMDGTIYLGETLFPETRPFLETLSQLGIGTTFVTNNPTRTRRELVAHLAAKGITVTESQISTPLQPAIDHLRAALPDAQKVLLLGTPSMLSELKEQGLTPISDLSDEPDVVILSFNPDLAFEWLCKAAWWIEKGKPYVATHPDGFCPTDKETVLLDCGSLIAAVKAAIGRDPDLIIGKPELGMAEAVLHQHQLSPSQLAIVGDRLHTDLAMAHRVGALAVLVLTGESTAEQAVNADPAPHLVLSNLGEFRQLLISSRSL